MLEWERKALWTYGNNGKKNVAGSRSLKGRYRRVDERVDRRRGKDQSSGEKTHNLSELAIALVRGSNLPTATWYVLSASEATVTVTPAMQKNMKTRVHHAKLGKPPWMADIMELMKAMTQASCIRG